MEPLVIPSGLTLDNLDKFYLFPSEIQCLILSYAFDLETLVALRETNSYYHDLIRDCATTLIPRDQSSQEVTSDFIVSLPNLVRCYYPISLRRLDDLFRIINHPHLRYAILDFNKYHEISSQEYRKYQEWSFLPILLQHLQKYHEDSSCQTCHKKENYNYIIVVSSKDSLRLTSSSIYIKRPATADLILPLFITSTICRYHGPVESSYRDKLLALPCLRFIKTSWDRLTFETYVILQQHNKHVILNRVLEDWQNNNLPNNYLVRLDILVKNTDEPYRDIYDFMPFTLEYLPDLKRIFPDLHNVHLLIRNDETIPWSELRRYRRIILYLQKDNNIVIPNTFLRKAEIKR